MNLSNALRARRYPLVGWPPGSLQDRLRMLMDKVTGRLPGLFPLAVDVLSRHIVDYLHNPIRGTRVRPAPHWTSLRFEFRVGVPPVVVRI